MSRMYSEAEVTVLRHEIAYLKAEKVIADKGCELLNKALTHSEDEAERYRQSAIRFKRRAEAAEAALAQGIEAGTGETRQGLDAKHESPVAESDAP